MSADTTSTASVPKGHDVNPNYRPAEAVVSGGGASMNVSLAAIEAIQKNIAKRGTPVESTALRVGIRGGGCSGFSYVIEFHDGAPRARDRVMDFTSENGTKVRVLVDPKSLVYLNGSTLDWEKTVMQQGFKFRNPNEKTSCGCGTSFTV
jgi:iron-sulfur cluster assembly protein